MGDNDRFIILLLQ